MRTDHDPIPSSRAVIGVRGVDVARGRAGPLRASRRLAADGKHDFRYPFQQVMAQGSRAGILLVLTAR
jgi:hypothetical protein